MDNRPKKPCKFCKEVNPLHFPFQCRENPKNKNRPGIPVRKPLPSPRKRIKQRGKQYNKWLETRKHWFEEFKAPYYWCYICNKQLLQSEVTLDHIKARSSHPELRYKFSNLAPCCWQCNSEKGSMSLEYFKLNRAK